MKPSVGLSFLTRIGSIVRNIFHL